MASRVATGIRDLVREPSLLKVARALALLKANVRFVFEMVLLTQLMRQLLLKSEVKMYVNL